MLGGRKTAQHSGLNIPLRDILYSRMANLPEGSLFQRDDIVQSPDETDDFIALKGFDYVQVLEGYFTQIIETQNLRRLPKVMDIMASYCALRDCSIVETGDRTAYKNGLKQWEPILGYRFHTNRNADLLTLGHMKIRVISGPDWIRDTSAEASLFRCFYDQPVKDIHASLLQARRPAVMGAEKLIAAAEFGAAIDTTELPEGWMDPKEVATAIFRFLKSQEDK